MLNTLLLLIYYVQGGYISTWDFGYEYDIEGKLSLISIPFRLETTIDSGYLQFGGADLHKTQMSEVICTVSTLEGVLVLKSIASLVTQPSFTSDYYFKVSVQLNAGIWYLLSIYPTSVDSGFYYEPIILRTISSLDDNAMIYDYNYRAAHLNVDELPPSGMTITFLVDQDLYPNYDEPGAQYVITIFITPRENIKGAQIELQIVQGQHTDGIDDTDFKILSKSCWSKFTSYTCTTTEKSIKLITQDDIISNTQLQIQFGVENPGFVSQRDIRVVTKSPTQGNRIIEKGFRSNVFGVTTIPTQLEGVQFLWGIDSQEDLTDTQVGVFKLENAAVMKGPYNSIKVSFSVSASANLVFPLTVKIKFNCIYALSYATKHNFQSYNDENPVYCEFVTDSILCHNVGTLSASSVYFISTKALYDASSSASEFGKLSFYLEQSVTANTLYIYGDNPGITITYLQDSHYLDLTGWHNPSGGLLGQTQVTSIPTDTLTNLDAVFGSAGTVGVVNGDKMLLFFIKTSSTQVWDATAVSCPSTAANYIKMTIMMNSMVLHSDQQNAPKKLQYIANDGGGVFSDEQLICIQKGYCDIGNQNTYTIYSSSNTAYGIATFISGGGCVTNFINENNNFIGTSGSTPGQQGVIGIPVTFSTNFVQSSQYADEQLLDFIVNFYKVDSSGQNKISQHLINAYTISRVNDLQVSFVNYYMGTTVGNDGSFIPTLLRIKIPSLSVAFDKVQVFFDSKIQLFTSYPDCYKFSAQNGPSEAWMLHQSIICDKSNQILIPIIPKGLTYTLHIGLTSQIDGILTNVPIKVYRPFGLPVSGETRKYIPSVFTVESSDLTFPFVRTPFVFDMHIDTTKFQDGSAYLDMEITTSSNSNVDLEQNQNSHIGAGLTLTSIDVNLFDEAIIESYFGDLQCTQFVYNTNIYTTFCPFDTQINYPLHISNQVVILYGRYSKIGSFVSYALSNSKGILQAALQDSGVIDRQLYTCKLDSTSQIYANSLGQQRLQFPIRFSSSLKLGGTNFGSIKIVITLTLAISGVNVVTSTNLCTIQGVNNIACTYTSTATTITVILTSSVVQVIQPNTVIKLTFMIQSTYGLTSFGTNQPFKVQIYVPTIRSGKTQPYGDTYDTPAVLQEQCNYNLLNLQNTQLGKIFYIGNLRLETPTSNGVGKLIFDFRLQSAREYLSSSQQYIQIALGFLRDQNMESSKLKCQIYEGLQLSKLIYSVDTSTMPNIIIKFNQDITNPHNILFTMKCKNFETPTNTYSTESLIGKLIDSVGTTIIQSSSPIGYAQLSTITYTPKGQILLQSKTLNSPGFDAIYEFAITNADLKILLTYMIKLQFHDGISLSPYVSCQLNSTFCYCTLKDGIYIINVCIVIKPTELAILRITLPQPNRLHWPILSSIYIAIDKDDDFTNGVYMQEILTDTLQDEYQTQPIEVVDTTLSSYYIRTSQTHKLSLLLPSGSVMNGNILFVQFPSFYMDPLSRATGVTCSITRDDDNTKTNFTTTCTIITEQYIQMILSEDSANNLIKQYTIELGNIPLPEANVPDDPTNDYRLKVHIIQSGNTKVKFTSAFYYSSPVSLIQEDKQDVIWSGGQFQYERDENLNIIDETSKIINIFIGTYRTLISLQPTSQSSFQETFGFQKSILKTFPSSLSANSGSKDSQFLAGADPNITIGYSVFKFSKLTGGSNYVSVLPNIYANIVNSPYQLTTDQTLYQIPQGGTSQPITINVENCFPMSDLRIQLANDNSALNVISNNPQNIIYSGKSQYKLYFDKYEYIWQVNNNDTVLEVGTKVQLSFILTGVSAPYYLPPPNITIEIIASPADLPVLEFDSQPIAYKNDIKFAFKCNNIGTLFWVIGSGGDITYIPLEEIYNQTIYQGYSRTQRNVSDLEWKIYGFQIINGVAKEHFSGLKSFSDYTIQAYCADLVGVASEALIYNWQTRFNGGNGIKLNITFSSPLTSIQQLELICGINYIFTIDYNRITDARGQMCNIETLEILSLSSNDIVSTLTGVQTSYYIYFQPDLSLMDETINDVVQNALSDKKSFISLLSNKMSLDPEEDPTIFDAVYSEPDQSTKPTLNYTKPEVGSVNATMNFTLSKAKGYVGIGIEQTDTAQIPSINQIRKSINYLGRSLHQSFLLFFNYSSAIQNQTQQVWFTNLSPNLKYKIYWFYSNDDTGSLAKVSNVSSVQIQTSPSQTYSGGRIHYLLLIMIMILIH
ncbi:unnamed protein product [Paramecium octaurelia]|uniref:Uncharacterized protein n=1 Tax=Paramecium octaurelia TaxID=43137 RepID=A0A8S1TZU2_PAROT|nr:unnamed protein product [Paramecium octaurelia]